MELGSVGAQDLETYNGDRRDCNQGKRWWGGYRRKIMTRY
jgi:hypothetical protein